MMTLRIIEAHGGNHEKAQAEHWDRALSWEPVLGRLGWFWAACGGVLSEGCGGDQIGATKSPVIEKRDWADVHQRAMLLCNASGRHGTLKAPLMLMTISPAAIWMAERNRRNWWPFSKRNLKRPNAKGMLECEIKGRCDKNKSRHLRLSRFFRNMFQPIQFSSRYLRKNTFRLKYLYHSNLNTRA